MRILHISAQKPGLTGSGVYLMELVRAFGAMGHSQGLVAGIDKTDEFEFPKGLAWYPVSFRTQGLPFPVVGMSDEMPYVSTRYCDLTEEMTETFFSAFRQQIQLAVEEVEPDLIICHHLYLLTAFVRELFPNLKLVGICHGTDIRQLEKHDLRRAYIKEQISHLDICFCLHRAQEDKLRELLGSGANIRILGAGFNQKYFHRMGEEELRLQNQETACKERMNLADEQKEIRILFAGKLSEKKGVMSLIKAFSQLRTEDEIRLFLAGGVGSVEEREEVEALISQCDNKVVCLGKLDQRELGVVMNQCQVFILPSFYEGLPLVLLEAMACGMEVIVTKLPGIKEWMDQQLPDHGIRFVEPPEMKWVDEPVEDSLPEFEGRLIEALLEEEKKLIDRKMQGKEEKRSRGDMTHLSWQGICQTILKETDERPVGR